MAKRILYSFIIFCGILSAALPVINHHYIDRIEYKKQLFECTVECGNKQMDCVKLYLKDAPKKPFQEYNMINNENVYQLNIIPEMLKGDTLYYFIIARFKDHSWLALPKESPETQPMKSVILHPDF